MKNKKRKEAHTLHTVLIYVEIEGEVGTQYAHTEFLEFLKMAGTEKKVLKRTTYTLYHHHPSISSSSMFWLQPSRESWASKTFVYII